MFQTAALPFCVLLGTHRVSSAPLLDPDSNCGKDIDPFSTKLPRPLENGLSTSEPVAKKPSHEDAPHLVVILTSGKVGL
jgi:hypothetical protein